MSDSLAGFIFGTNGLEKDCARFVNRPAYYLPPGFDPPDTFEKHEAVYKQLKAAGMIPPEQKPEKSFWQWLFG